MEWLMREENASALEKVTIGVPWLNVCVRPVALLGLIVRTGVAEALVVLDAVGVDTRLSLGSTG